MRIPTFVLIIATLVTIVRMVMDKFLPSIYDALGIYLPLIVVNCIILARAESFASKNPVLDSALDGLFMGIGFTCSLTLMGLFREVLGAGTFFGVKLWGFKIAFLLFERRVRSSRTGSSSRCSTSSWRKFTKTPNSALISGKIPIIRR